MSDSLWPHELQHTRLPCPSASPKVCSNSCPLSQYAHSTVSSSVVPFSSCHQLSQHQGLFLRVTLHIRWPKYWSFSFSISPSNKYLGLISFKIDWFDLLTLQGILKSFPAPQFKSINSSVLSFLYNPTLAWAHDYWKNHSFGYTDFCQKNYIPLLFNMLSRFVITFLPRSKRLLISSLQSSSAVILEP